MKPICGIIDLIQETYTVRRVSQNVYTTKEHDSLRIWKDRNQFFWYSQGFGGGPKEWLIKVLNFDTDAAFEYSENFFSTFETRRNAIAQNNVYELYQLSGKKIYHEYIKNRKISEVAFHHFGLMIDTVLNKVLIPIFDRKNNRIGAVVRRMFARKENRYKNILTTDTRPFIWPFNQQPTENVILFEGCWSVMRWWDVVKDSDYSFFSIFGTFPSKQLVQFLNELNITVVLDNDLAGLKLQERLKALGMKAKYFAPDIYPDELSNQQILKLFGEIKK